MVQPAEEEIESILRMFSVADYVVLALLLMVCVGIGTFYGFFSGKVTTEDYLIGGRKMKLLPTSLSLIATFISGVTLMGTPADTYLNGSQFVYSSFGDILVGFVMPWAFLPVLHQLRLTTVYQYLEMRFNKSVRIFISILCVIKMFLSIPRYVYPPAVVFNQVTGESLHYGSALLTIVCIYYTCVGGFKAVVWTDVFQCIFMYGSLLLVIIKGTIDIGGPAVVFERSNAGGRLEPPNFDLNPTIYYTFWSLTIGIFCSHLNQHTFYQGMLQRYISIPSLGTAKIAALITSCVGSVLFCVTCSYFGLLIYAEFHDCDPITTKVAKGKDQVVPLFVMKTLGHYPGLPGIFVGGIFSAALSTVSSVLNALSAVALEDFYKIFIRRPITERESNILMRSVVIFFGIAGGALVYVIEKIGTIIQITYTVGTMTDGPALGVFLMGFFLPFVNTQPVELQIIPKDTDVDGRTDNLLLQDGKLS
ncbi:sodium-coupled monocarboxylate transporter 1 isoform X2 [Anabrus simplex]|uniref:sodium-coupled monocarboxylate transporter 1 isoform X2 n=1 Tax=Anabrus simplex TaxID=316456 RepID=UPI0035A38F58